MAKESKRVEDKGIVLDKTIVDQLDLSKIPIGQKEETAEVSGQCNLWVKSPCNGQWWLFPHTYTGYHLLRDATGCVWTQYLYC